MGRVIKLRIWDTWFEEMCDISSIQFPLKKADGRNKNIPKGSSIVEGNGISGTPYRDIVVTDKNPPMQFTGLLDRNKNEIYEGDILKIETEDRQLIYVVCEYGIARREMSSGWIVDIPSFYFKRNDGLLSFPIVENWAGKHDLEMIEVIGNIFQNPELIPANL